MTRLIATDRFGAYLFDLADVVSAVRTRNVDGTDSLQLTWRGGALEKDDRVLVRFATGEWREYMVASTSRTRAAGLGAMTAACRNSVAELSRKYHVELEGRGYAAAQALAKCLSGTRWSAGTVDVPASKTANVSFYHQSALDSLEDICEAYGCEVDATVEVSGSKVTARKVHLLTAIGSASAKRFEYRKDLLSVKRTVNADDVVTRVYAWGKGLQATDADGNATGGYTRKIGIADVNGGKAYVEDAAATKRFGVPDASGVPQPAEGSYENGDVEDPSELLALAKADLAARCEPTVSYECGVASLAQAGMSPEGVACGDSVHIVDAAFDPPLRLEGRVLQVVEDLAGGRDSAKVTLGNVCEPITRRNARVESAVQRLTQSAGAWDGAAGLSEGYLDGVISGVNAVLNATGGYTYMEPGQGILIYDRPRDQSPTMCIQLGGGYFRIADGKNADGTWAFRTLGTGHGLVADEIVSGTLDAALIKAGILQDAAGSNYWNMETGDFRLAGVALDKDAIAGVDVEFAQGSSATEPPVGGWQTSAPAWAKGRYIWQRTKTTMADGTVSYTAPVCISGRDGVDGKDGANGIDGKDGVAGAPGKDGVCTYFHRAYANSADGKAGFSVTYGAGKTYLGTYVDSVQADSADPAKYQWSKIKGEDGADGIPGVNGDDGKTYYLHIAYAESADGETGFSVAPKATSTYIGQCVDLDVADPTTPSSYAWALIKGADGDDGLGVSSVVEEYYLSTSSSYRAGGTWSVLPPEWVSGRYYWTRTAVTWDDGTVTYTTPVLARGVNGANKTAQDAKDAVDDLDDSLDQREIFNRLTNDGKTQGIYMSNGLLYLNASYMGAGMISNRYNNTNYWNLDTGTLRAGSITATGSFLGGSKSSGYGMELTTGGRLAGYYGGTQYGYIDCSATSTYIPTGETWRGIQIQAKQNVRISSPHISACASSDTSQTATVAGTGSLVFMTFPNGMPGEKWNLDSVSLQATSVSFVNGLCTRAF